MLPLPQSELEYKLKLFLTSLGEAFPENARGGICNGLAFMNFRADILDQENKNIRRMSKISAVSNAEIQNLAQIYKEYKKIEMKLQQKKFNELEKKTFIEENFSQKAQEDINFAKEIYYYIHSAIAAHFPRNYFLSFNNKAVNQCDYDKILTIFEPEIKTKKVFSISFVFRENELNQLLFDKQIIREGDFIRLSSIYHSAYLSYKKGQYILYNPAPINIDNSKRNIVSLIKKNLFPNMNSAEMKNIPLTLHVFSKQTSEQTISRPSSVDVFYSLIEKREDKNKDINAHAKDGVTALYLAAANGNFELVKALILAKANIYTKCEDGFTPALLAAQNGHARVVKYLANINPFVLDSTTKHNDSAATLAAAYYHTKVFKIIAESNPTMLGIFNYNQWSPALLAAVKGHVDIIKIVADVNPELLNNANKLGVTPAMLAAYNGHIEVIAVLAKAKADFNLTDKEGSTALDHACKAKRTMAIKALIKAGAVKCKLNEKKDANIVSLIILQFLKKYIETHAWLGSMPALARNHLHRIEQAEAIDDWKKALDDILAMPQPTTSSNLLFSDTLSKADNEYQAWFYSKEALIQALFHVFSKTSVENPQCAIT